MKHMTRVPHIPWETWAQDILNDPNAQLRAMRAQAYFNSYPELVPAAKKNGIDPNDPDTAPKAIVAEARGYQNPLDVQAKQATINESNPNVAKTNMEIQALRRNAALINGAMTGMVVLIRAAAAMVCRHPAFLSNGPAAVRLPLLAAAFRHRSRRRGMRWRRGRRSIRRQLIKRRMRFTPELHRIRLFLVMRTIFQSFPEPGTNCSPRSLSRRHRRSTGDRRLSGNCHYAEVLRQGIAISEPDAY